jgi:N-acetylglucosaminyldiphosphoundecaprenol N-acetyl-beta-D-mannosaminyltransferase
VDNISHADLLAKVDEWAEGNSCKLIFTPGPEMCVASQGNDEFRAALDKSDLNLADGFGLVLATKVLYSQKLERNPGADTVDLLIAEASRKGWRIYLLGAGRGVAAAAAEKILSQHPSLKIGHWDLGFTVDSNGTSEKTSDVLSDIAKHEPDILLVALGAPKQELWLTQNRDALSEAGVRIGMGVGGTLDYIAGIATRGPAAFRRMGLEWLWRLIKQPKRFLRIATATLIFSILVLKQKASLKAG